MNFIKSLILSAFILTTGLNVMAISFDRDSFPFLSACKEAAIESKEDFSNYVKPYTSKVASKVEQGLLWIADKTCAVEVPAIEVPAIEVPAIEVPAIEVPAIEVPKVSFIARNKYTVGGAALVALAGAGYYAYTKCQEKKTKKETTK